MAKSATARKAVKKTAAKKTSAKKTSAKKTPAKKTTAKKVSAKKAAAKKAAAKKYVKKVAPKKWSANVTEHSDAMDLEQHIFESEDPKEIAASVSRSAEKSNRKKAGPFQSAMSMINFYENRAGKNLSAAQKKVLDEAKNELRKLYGREEQ
jgi:hypothetical protein